MTRLHKPTPSAAIGGVVIALVVVLVGAAGLSSMNAMQRGLAEMSAIDVPALASLFATEHYLDRADQDTVAAINKRASP